MTSSAASVPAPARGGVSRPEPASSLAGSVGVLDRADGATLLRTRPVHTHAFRASVRAVPLRSVQLAPPPRHTPALPAARTPTVTVVPEPVRRPITGWRDLSRRAALWGGGAHGEHLAWRTPEPAPRAPLRPRLRALTRRIALWGAGPRGEHLAWGGARPSPAPRQVDPPVLLRELPSTPTIRPTASSPAVALIPAPTVAPRAAAPTVLRAARPAPVVPAAPRWSPPPAGRPRPPAGRSLRQPAPAAVRTTVIPPLPPVADRSLPGPRSPAGGARAGPACARGDPLSRPAPRPALAAPG
jgi:hypothetical protein